MNQGEIWHVVLDPTVGAEMNKTRPALIINDNRVGKLPLKIIIPITGWKEHYSIAPWMIKIEPNEENGLAKISSLDCFQIRSVSKERLIEKIGEITPDEINKVQDGIIKVLGI
ncbi:MAG: type II toxin-antitoxin system PemK/MazF family toxin [Treponema sp.]|jgi:mRNA interferase MazF|nr:type II toxin-antitoxin system PemK/MazF family toxin [Treponema sp.]